MSILKKLFSRKSEEDKRRIAAEKSLLVEEKKHEEEERKRKIAAEKSLLIEAKKRELIGEKASRDAGFDETLDKPNSQCKLYYESLKELMYKPENRVEAKRVMERFREENDKFEDYEKKASNIPDNEEAFIDKLRKDTKYACMKAENNYSEYIYKMSKAWRDWNKRFPHLSSNLDDPKKNDSNDDPKKNNFPVGWIWIFGLLAIGDFVVGWNAFAQSKSISDAEAALIAVGLLIGGATISIIFGLLTRKTWYNVTSWFSFGGRLLASGVIGCLFLGILLMGANFVVQLRLDSSLSIQSAIPGLVPKADVLDADVLKAFEQGREDINADHGRDPAQRANITDASDEIFPEGQRIPNNGGSSPPYVNPDEGTSSHKKDTSSPEKNKPVDVLFAWAWFVIYVCLQILVYYKALFWDVYSKARECRQKLDVARKNFERESLNLINTEYGLLKNLANETRELKKTISATIQYHRADFDRVDEKALSDANADAQIYHHAYSKFKIGTCPELPNIEQKNAEEYRVGIPKGERKFFTERVQYLEDKFIPDIKRYADVLKSLLDKIILLLEEFRIQILMKITAWEKKA